MHRMRTIIVGTRAILRGTHTFAETLAMTVRTTVMRAAVGGSFSNSIQTRVRCVRSVLYIVNL